MRFLLNLFSGETYTRTGDTMISSDGDTYNRVGDNWINKDGDLIQKVGKDYFNPRTGVFSSFGDPFQENNNED